MCRECQAGVAFNSADLSYTSNWPHEPLVSNRPTGEAVVWTGVSVTVGAELFGFMINPPIALYYMQGLNTTAVHAHAALFGVYGMLGIGLMLMCLRAILPGLSWKEGMHTNVMQTLRWLRVPGDTIFALGAIALVGFVTGLKTGHSLKSGANDDSQARESKRVS